MKLNFKKLLNIVVQCASFIIPKMFMYVCSICKLNNLMLIFIFLRKHFFIELTLIIIHLFKIMIELLKLNFYMYIQKFQRINYIFVIYFDICNYLIYMCNNMTMYSIFQI